MAKLGDDVKMIPGPVPLVAPTGPMWAGTGTPAEPSPLVMTPGRTPLMPPEERAAWQAAHQQDLAQAAQREAELAATGASRLSTQEVVPDSNGSPSVTLGDGRRVLVSHDLAGRTSAMPGYDGPTDGAADAVFRDNTKPLAAPDDPSALPGQQPPMDQSGRAGASAGFSGSPEPKLALSKDPAAAVYDTTKEQEAIRHKAEAEYNTTQLVATAKSMEALEIAKHDEAAAKAEAAYQDTLANASNSYAAVAAKLNDLSPTIDPGRTWKNKDAGQKVASGLAAFLFGFSGKGIEFLQQQQAEIDTDVKAQQAEYENASNKLKAQLAAQDNIYAMHRGAGLDARTARAAARANMHDRWASQIEAIKASGAGPEIMARADLAQAHAQQQGVLRQSELNQAAQQAGHQKRAEQIEIYKIEKESRDRLNAAILAAERSRMAQQDQIAAAQQNKIEDLAAARELGKKTEELVGGDHSKIADAALLTAGDIPVLGGLVKAGAGALQGDQSVFARNKKAEENQMVMKKVISGEAMQENDVRRMLESATRPGLAAYGQDQLSALQEATDAKLKAARDMQRAMNTKGSESIPNPSGRGSSIKSLKKE